MYRVLMVCTGNICRSPMAAGLLRHHLPKGLEAEIDVSSAGTHALQGNQAQEHALEAMDKIGIDIHQHRARQITRKIAQASNLILTMEDAHLISVKGLLSWRGNQPRKISEFDSETGGHDIADPYGEPLHSYKQCILTLLPCIQGVISWLCDELDITAAIPEVQSIKDRSLD